MHKWHDQFTFPLSFRKCKVGAQAKDKSKMQKKTKKAVNDCDFDLGLELFVEAGAGPSTTKWGDLTLTPGISGIL